MTALRAGPQPGHRRPGIVKRTCQDQGAMGEDLVKDRDFPKEIYAGPQWHPMAHPADMCAHAPRVPNRASGARFAGLDGHEAADAAGGQRTVRLGHCCDPGPNIPVSPPSAMPECGVDAIISAPGTGLGAA